MNRFAFDKIQSAFPKVWGGGHVRLQCGNGWLPIIEELSAKLDAVLATEELAHTKVLTVQEQSGRLDFRVEILSASKSLRKQILDLIQEAEDQSTQTCEQCGTTENVLTRKNKFGWYTTCEDCMPS